MYFFHCKCLSLPEKHGNGEAKDPLCVSRQYMPKSYGGISDEEAYSDQLTFFMVGGILKAFTSDTEGMVNDFINKIANKQISREVAEYNKNKEMMTVMTIQMAMALKGFFGEMSEKEITKLEKLTKKLQDTEMFKRIMENSEKDEGNANFESTEDKESNIYHGEKKKYDK